MNSQPSSRSHQQPLAPQSVRALRGPNVWTRCTAIEVLIELQARHAQLTSEQGRAICERFPALHAVDLGPTLAHALGRISLTLQAQAGCAVAFSRTVAIAPLSFKVVVEYVEEEVGRRALQLGQGLVEAALDDRPFDTAAALHSLRTLDERVRLGPSTASIARAAERRAIPVRRLTDGNLLQLGWGCRQRRVWTAETDRTSAVAELVAKDKELTKTLLRAVGVPVPEGRVASDAEDAWRAARELGVPVVVKPLDGNHGRGVAVGLTTREGVATAFQSARREGEMVLVERFAPGFDHRLLVIGGKLVAAARREPPRVIGDGARTLYALIEAENQDPRRGEDHATSLSRIPLDETTRAVLAEQGYAPESVPAAGAVVALRRNGNLSTGGSAEDVTDRVHPSLAAHAVEAARAVGLDIAGIDFVCGDVSVPLEEQSGVVVEVNAGPGFRMHLAPSSGQPRPVGEAVVDSLFAEGDDARIPVVAISGNNGKTTTTRLVAHIFQTMGKRVGMTCTDGLYIEGRRIDDGDCAGPKSARTALFHPLVEVAVLETARGGLLREGLGFDRCEVAVVTNVGRGDHLGQSGIVTAEQLAEVKRTVVENVAPSGTAVLNAADPLTAAMAPFCPGSVTFFAREPSDPTLEAHRARGGRAVFVEEQAIVVAEGPQKTRIIELGNVPMTLGGLIAFQIENALAAVGAAWAAGIPWEAIRTALSTFVTDPRSVPGRFNVLGHRGATVIADYGHNPDALQAIADAIEKLPARRRVVVLSCAGDRRDEDILHVSEIAGNAFDEVILYEDACNRGRADGEVIGLMRHGLGKGRRVAATSEYYNELAAMQAGLNTLQPGDLLVALVDQIEASLAFLEKTVSERKPSVPRPPSAAAA